LPHIREQYRSKGSFISSNDTLLVAMLSSEAAVAGQTYTNGAKNVNIHPDHTVPIEVWLSMRDEDLRAAGVTSRLIEEGYAPTDDDVMRDYNKRHLRAIVCLRVTTSSTKRHSAQSWKPCLTPPSSGSLRTSWRCPLSLKHSI
jgi:hypothetical protein